MSNFATVIGLKEYRKYFASALLAAVGNGMYFVAISWYLFNSGGLTMAIGWSLIAATLPGLLLSPVVGVLVDKWNAKHVCAMADLLRGIMLLLLAFGMGTGTLKPMHIYVATFFVALCDNFYQPAIGALVRNVVSKDNLLPANIVGSMASQIGTLVGASIGGFAIALFGTGTVVSINAGSFLLSAGLIMWIRHQAVDAPAPSPHQENGVIAQFRRALQETPDRMYLLTMAGQQILAYLTVFICNTLLPGYVVKELHSGPEGFGLIDAGWGVGALLGGVLLSILVKRLQAARLGALGLLVFGLGLIALYAAQDAKQAALAYLMLGCFGAMIRVNGDTEILRIVDPSHFGKIKSGIIMMISWCSLIVYGAVGYLGDVVSARSIYLVVAGVVIFVGAFMLFRMRRPLARPALT
jgi:DHA3 family macrolide efflux protein-like MFS transporter